MIFLLFNGCHHDVLSFSYTSDVFCTVTLFRCPSANNTTRNNRFLGNLVDFELDNPSQESQSHRVPSDETTERKNDRANESTKNKKRI